MAMMQQLTALSTFSCLGAQCPDTCCKGWGMQITEQTLAKYRQDAPALLETVTTEQGGMVMKRDTCSDYCVNYAEGLCAVHRDYGKDFLGDACHFFPRSTKQLGEKTVMSAALSCPEIVRLAVVHEQQATDYYRDVPLARQPYSIKHYLPEEMAHADAWSVHHACIKTALEEGLSVEQALLRLFVLAEGLSAQPLKDWADATPLYLKLADGRMPEAQGHIADAFNLLNIVAMLLQASVHRPNPRLQQTLQEMQQALGVQFDAIQGTLQLSDDSAQRWLDMVQAWHTHHHHYAAYSKQWLAAQLALGLFPFAGLGENLVARVTIIALRYATIRLALMSYWAIYQHLPSEEDYIRIVQSLARFMDHLSDPTSSMQLYEQMEWTRLARLRGMLIL